MLETITTRLRRAVGKPSDAIRRVLAATQAAAGRTGQARLGSTGQDRAEPNELAGAPGTPYSGRTATQMPTSHGPSGGQPSMSWYSS